MPKPIIPQIFFGDGMADGKRGNAVLFQFVRYGAIGKIYGVFKIKAKASVIEIHGADYGKTIVGKNTFRVNEAGGVRIHFHARF